jgi:hypothetical protein
MPHRAVPWPPAALYRSIKTGGSSLALITSTMAGHYKIHIITPLRMRTTIEMHAQAAKEFLYLKPLSIHSNVNILFSMLSSGLGF